MSDDFIEEFVLSDEGEDAALNFSPLASFGKGRATVPGLLRNIVVDDTEEAYAEKGEAHIPAGQVTNVPKADTVSGLYGLVGKAEFKALQGKKPTFTNGDLNIPLAQAPGDTCNGTVDDDTPGGIVGIGYSLDGAFHIKDGYARIPKPPEPGYFPDGLYNAETGEKISWQTFLAGTSPVPLSQPASGLRIMAFHLGKYITFYLEQV